MSDPKQEIKYVTFNQDQSCFACATIYGFKVFMTKPYKVLVVRDLKEPVRIIEMFNRTNLFALVGASNLSPKLNTNKVSLWDDNMETFIAELTFKTKNTILVAIDGVIYIHKMSNLDQQYRIETVTNPENLIGYSINEKVLAYVEKDSLNNLSILQLDRPNSKKLVVKAHSSSISILDINPQGTLVATSSEKGTLIRLYSTEDGTRIQEFRRGTDHQRNVSLSFSIDSCFVSCLTETGTAYVFVVGSEVDKGNDDKKEDEKNKKVANTKSKLSMLKVVSSFFDAEWSYAHLKLTDRKGTLTSIAFQPETKFLYGIGEDGTIALGVHDEINVFEPTSQKAHIKSLIEDGYSGVAFNYEFTGQLLKTYMNPMKPIDMLTLLEEDQDLFSKPHQKSRYENFKQLSRITVVLNETRYIQQISESNDIIKSYDLVAVRTNDQKIFYSLCLENEVVDIISFNMNEKLPFMLKRGPVTEAIKKGIMFELCYSSSIQDPQSRRLAFSNAIQIIKATKGKNIIISSGCKDPFYRRGPYDVICLSTVWELAKDDAKKSVSDNPATTIKKSCISTQKNFKGTIAMATQADLEEFEKKEKEFLTKKKLKTSKHEEEKSNLNENINKLKIAPEDVKVLEEEKNTQNFANDSKIQAESNESSGIQIEEKPN